MVVGPEGPKALGNDLALALKRQNGEGHKAGSL
jgi:hypothetical protein